MVVTFVLSGGSKIRFSLGGHKYKYIISTKCLDVYSICTSICTSV